MAALDTKVFVEWYGYLRSKGELDTWKITGQRIARLYHLLKEANRPNTLHALDTISFMDKSGAYCFGLVFRLPGRSSESIQLVTLYQLLSRDLPNSLLSLEKTYELAAMLAKSKSI